MRAKLSWELTEYVRDLQGPAQSSLFHLPSTPNPKSLFLSSLCSHSSFFKKTFLLGPSHNFRVWDW